MFKPNNNNNNNNTTNYIQVAILSNVSNVDVRQTNLILS